MPLYRHREEREQTLLQGRRMTERQGLHVLRDDSMASNNIHPDHHSHHMCPEEG